MTLMRINDGLSPLQRFPICRGRVQKLIEGSLRQHSARPQILAYRMCRLPSKDAPNRRVFPAELRLFQTPIEAARKDLQLLHQSRRSQIEQVEPVLYELQTCLLRPGRIVDTQQMLDTEGKGEKQRTQGSFTVMVQAGEVSDSIVTLGIGKEFHAIHFGKHPTNVLTVVRSGRRKPGIPSAGEISNGSTHQP